MEKKSIIEVRDLTVKYGETTILENVNFDVYKGEIFLIVGVSGCGKSTLLRQIIGLEQPTMGKVIVDGEDFTESYGQNRLNILKKFGILFQSSGLFASMTLAENIALLLESHTNLNAERLNEIIALKLDAVGLNGYQNYIPSEISGGMKKRAALARAMTLDPDILCFDEPSSGLDPITSASLDNLILDLNHVLNTTMIVVSHDLASILRIADRVIIIDKDKKGILAEDTPAELQRMKENEAVYNFFNRIA